MRIRAKIILVVLPLLMVSLTLTAAVSYRTAMQGMVRATQRFFNFKIRALYTYTKNQWDALEGRGTQETVRISAAQSALQGYARSIIASDTEIILAVDARGNLAMATAPLELSPEEKGPLLSAVQDDSGALGYGVIGGKERVFRSFYAAPLGWHVLLTEERSVFYPDLMYFGFQILILICLASLGIGAFLSIFTGFIKKSLGETLTAMERVITSGDLSSRAEVLYPDETGGLARGFNVLMEMLEKTFTGMKQYAFKAALAQKKEQRIRQVFQKYVPKEQVDSFFGAAEPMPAGDRREVAVLVSDVRGFSGLSEKMAPQDLIDSLNRCFSDQADIIMRRQGMIDKFTGDAITAFWGAPIAREDDAMQAVLTALDLLEGLKKFNSRQRSMGKPEFNIGVGLSYGTAVAGNIGSGRKMEYTIIGDTVNLAFQIEAFSKIYKESLLLSESLYIAIKNKEPKLPIRLLDTIPVKGKPQGVKIYTVKRSVTVPEAKAWGYYHEGMSLYYRRSFEEAVQQFRKALVILHEDPTAEILLARCLAYVEKPPPGDWNGVG